MRCKALKTSRATPLCRSVRLNFFSSDPISDNHLRQPMPKLPRILMILTSHRLDCFTLCIDLLARESLARFDVVAILCSGVEGRHRRYVEDLPRRFPGNQWEILHGARGRGKPIADLQNECVRRHPNALYFKLDEDTFVSRDWDLRVVEAYEKFQGDNRLSLITPVVTNNQRGAYHLLTTFAELGAEFTRRFNQPIVTTRMGPIWILPQCAEFMMRRFLNLDDANEELRAKHTAPFETFSYPFSINCICYDYRHWQEIGGVPEQDENGWGEWIPKHGKFIVLATQGVVHHYSFFVQQDWLDRTSLIEDIRNANLPGTKTLRQRLQFARVRRIAIQLPQALIRRMKSLA